MESPESSSEGSDADESGTFMTSRLDSVYMQRPPSAPPPPKLQHASSRQPIPPHIPGRGDPEAAGFYATLDSLHSLKQQGPAWWKLPERVADAADKFDKLHRESTGRAERFTKVLSRGGAECEQGGKLSLAHGSSMFTLRTNRYVEPYVRQKAVVYSGGMRKQKAAAGPKWDLYKSIWAPRAKWADSKDVWDTVEVRRKRFALLWSRCLDLGLAELVVRMDDGDGEDSDDGGLENLVEFGTDDDTRDDHPEVQDVKRVLWEWSEVSTQRGLTPADSPYAPCVPRPLV